MIDEELFNAWGRFSDAARNGTQKEALTERERLLDIISARAARPSPEPVISVSPLPRALNRNDYRVLSTPAILRTIAEAQWDDEHAETAEDKDRASFAMQELRAVLQERS